MIHKHVNQIIWDHYYEELAAIILCGNHPQEFRRGQYLCPIKITSPEVVEKYFKKTNNMTEGQLVLEFARAFDPHTEYRGLRFLVTSLSNLVYYAYTLLGILETRKVCYAKKNAQALNLLEKLGMAARPSVNSHGPSTIYLITDKGRAFWQEISEYV